MTTKKSETRNIEISDNEERLFPYTSVKATIVSIALFAPCL